MAEDFVPYKLAVKLKEKGYPQRCGGKYDMIGDTIERQFQTSYNYNLGASISLGLMVLLLVCMAFMNTFTNDEDEGGMIV